MDCVLHNISRFTTVQDVDRAPYTNDFDTVANFIICQMLNIDVVYKALFNGPYLAGSYVDNLKISKPDEFDLILRMKLRESKRVKIEKDKMYPGRVKLNLSECLQLIATQPHNKDVHQQLSKLVNKNGYLIQSKFQQWIEAIMTKIMLKNQSRLILEGEAYYFRYSKAGPAHTIFVTHNGRTFSIDFVPAIVFDITRWISGKRPPRGAITDWMVIPKPIKNYRGNGNISFQTSYADAERYSISGKTNLKSALRMIKKLRDRNNITNLKNYFIKTVFLWEDANQPNSFWNSSGETILVYMLSKILDFLKEKRIPFFWDPRENILSGLSDSQITSIYGNLNKQYTLILRYKDIKPEKLYKVFLTDKEIAAIGSQGNRATNTTATPHNRMDLSRCVNM